MTHFSTKADAVNRTLYTSINIHPRINKRPTERKTWRIKTGKYLEKVTYLKFYILLTVHHVMILGK